MYTYLRMEGVRMKKEVVSYSRFTDARPSLIYEGITDLNSIPLYTSGSRYVWTYLA
jgi:hypothetical protein